LTQLNQKSIINNLPLKLHIEKASNKPLANKMSQLVLKGTRQQTLEEADNNLQ
jgi:hypothetical protein